MITDHINPKEITRYSKPLIWLAAKRDRGKDIPPLTDCLERQLQVFLIREEAMKDRMIKERAINIKERQKSIQVRKKVDEMRDKEDQAYIHRLSEEINGIERVFDLRKQCAKEIIEAKKACYIRYKGGA